MLNLIEDYIKNCLPYFHGARVLDKAEYPKYRNTEYTIVLEGEITLKGQSVTIQIALDNHFPLHKPLFFLKPYNALGFIPHVDKRGFICYSHDEGLLIDISRVTDIIAEAFEKVVKTLNDGISRANHNDIQAEFEAYWDNLENVSLIESNVDLTDEVKIVKVAIFENYPIYFIGDGISDIMNYCYKYIGKSRMGNPTFVDAIYIPLKEGTNISPPCYGSFWKMNQFRHIIYGNVTDSNKKKIKRIVKGNVRQNNVFIILISIPLANGQKALIGVEYLNSSPIETKLKRLRERAFLHPFYMTIDNYKLVPLSVIRHDKEYIMRRGGGNNYLSNKKVALIGCGSVGGNIALELAKAGIENITLIDQDLIMQENVYRHVLGVNSLKSDNYKDNIDSLEAFTPKISGLKREIEQKFPYTKIDAFSNYTDSIENIMKKGDINFKQFDLVIVALGNPTIEIYLNEYFHKEVGMPPIIFTWVEAYGIGGHAILTNNNRKNGCLKCLYTDPFDSKAPLRNRASFAAEGQCFLRQISGCGSVYTPYGSLDSFQTAILATRLAIDVLSNKEMDNPVLSWKGNADKFLDSGFLLSEHYLLSSETLYNTRYLYKNDSCEICGHFKGVENV